MVAGRHRLTEHLRILTDNFRPVPPCFRFGPGSMYRLRVANDMESRRRAFALVYQQYLEKGYARAHPSRMWTTLYNALPEAVTLMIERGDEVVAALTAVPDSPLGLPADEHYKPELDCLRRSGRRPCEVISLGVGLGEHETLVLAKLFNAVYVYAYRVARLTDFVITITPNHARFYRRLLCFENLGPVRVHSRFNDTVACMETAACLERLRLVVADASTPEGREARRRRNLYQFFEAAAGEKELAEVIRRSIRPMTERELTHFFIEQSGHFAQAKPEQLAYLAERYLPYSVLSSPNAMPGAEALVGWRA